MQSKTRHVLLVEDNNGHADLISMTLNEADAVGTIDRVEDGEQAMSYVRREGRFAEKPRPDVILLDLKLPKVDGHQVLHFLKSHPDLRTIPVIILTTSGNDTDKRRAYDDHANSYLVKPYAFEDFHELVQQLQTYWCGWNELPASTDSLS